MISYALLLGFFYAQMYFFLPRLFFKKRYGAFILCLTGSFLLCALLPITIIPAHFHHWKLSHGNFIPNPPPDNKQIFLFTRYLFQFLVVALFSYSLQLNTHLKQAEQARTDAELGYLKAQINPHFLFNTLNSIYSLAIQGSEATADAVVQLSSMMRYILTEASKDFVDLAKEVEYISNYIALQKTRLSDNVCFDFSVEGQTGQKRIAPLLLIPFIENAFKYGVNPDEDCAIDIRLRIAAQELTLDVYNKKVKLRAEHNESSKVGIDNTRKRLDNLYAGKHLLQITEDASSYHVQLKITLNDYSNSHRRRAISA
ncbi:MAG: histidine kinase [Chitinophagaceae bacterium]|nr:histidine kinase [Chitinophagaceae bacterium]